MMIVLLRKAKPGLKGFVTRWLSEIGGGVFLGTVSTRVRDRLWNRIATEIGDGEAVMIFPAPTEQGYNLRTAGNFPYSFEDFEGIILAKKPNPK